MSLRRLYQCNTTQTVLLDFRDVYIFTEAMYCKRVSYVTRFWKKFKIVYFLLLSHLKLYVVFVSEPFSFCFTRL